MLALSDKRSKPHFSLSLKRKTGAWAGAVAMSLHLAIALFQIIPATAIAGEVDASRGAFVICALFDHETPTSPSKGKGDGNSGQKTCPVCILKNIGKNITQISPTVFSVSGIEISVTYFSLGLPLGGAPRNRPRPRGPPLTA